MPDQIHELTAPVACNCTDYNGKYYLLHMVRNFLYFPGLPIEFLGIYLMLYTYFTTEILEQLTYNLFLSHGFRFAISEIYLLLQDY